jgi:hypothetical protein
MVTTVIPRQLPGIASLGLLAALLAHTACYGGDHAVGGPYHTALLLAAIGGVGLVALAAGTLALMGARRHADGSILASELRSGIPGPVALMASGAAWFAAIETLEPHHASAPLAAVAVAIAIAAVAIAWAARALIDAVAQVAFAIGSSPFHKRTAFRRHQFSPPSSARAVAFAYRRFARPPPF